MSVTLLSKTVAAHPLDKKPYNAIKFSRVDGNGTILYRVAKDKKELGAKAALKLALERLGGHCFHCRKWMPPQTLSHECTRDHLNPKVAGGNDHLFNLVLACGPCNRSKGRSDLVEFHPERGAEFLKALDKHFTKCLEALAKS